MTSTDYVRLRDVPLDRTAGRTIVVTVRDSGGNPIVARTVNVTADGVTTSAEFYPTNDRRVVWTVDVTEGPTATVAEYESARAERFGTTVDGTDYESVRDERHRWNRPARPPTTNT